MKTKYTFILIITLFITLSILILLPLMAFREPLKIKKKGKKGKTPMPVPVPMEESKNSQNESSITQSFENPSNNDEINKCSTLLKANGIYTSEDSQTQSKTKFGVNTKTGVNDSIEPTTAADIGTDSEYSYLSFIKSPAELNMSDKGTLKTLENDIKGLISYVELLIEGSSKASKTKGPLGNKFFAKTLGKCKSVGPNNKGTIQDRYLYINNVPLGNIPMTDTNFKDFRGLIPGMLQNVSALNPTNVAASIFSSSIPDCMEITMDTIGSKGILGTATHYVSLADISELDPCLFPPGSDKKRRNPQTNAKCSLEGFESMHNINNDENNNYESESESDYESVIDIIQEDIKKDYISQAFLSSFSLFGIYILYLLIKKMK
jgi:hypothetical protein